MQHTLLQRVVGAMAEIAPLALADRSWDNVGVLVEAPEPNGSNKVLLTIDLTPAVMEECLAQNIEVILAYHPPIFSSMKRLTLQDPKQRIVLQAARRGISVYSPHTSLDAAEGGINDWLADIVDPRRTGQRTPIQPMTVESNGKTVPPHQARGIKTGMGRVVQLSAPTPFVQLVDEIKTALHLPSVRVSLPDGWTREHAVHSVAICAGSGSTLFRQLSSPVDVLFSGEMGHHDVLAANAEGKAVVLCEHSNTERGYLDHILRGRLEALLGDKVTVVVSTQDHDPLVMW